MHKTLLALWTLLLILGIAGCQGPSAATPPVSTPPASAATTDVKEPARGFDPLGDLEMSLVFFPSKYPEGEWKPALLTAPHGPAIEDARFASADGTKLHGWYLPHPRPRAVVLFCHGNAGNITHRAGVLRALHDTVGVSVLIFDYRGYGQSQGTPNEAGVLADARAARKWLAERAGVAERDIVLLGRSLGGGVAVDLASTDGAAALVLESTFTSIPDVGKFHYPLLPVGLIMRTKLNSLSKIAAYKGPLLQSHGDADTVVPHKLGKKLFEAANEPKQFINIPGADHNNPQPGAYFRELVAFLDKLP